MLAQRYPPSPPRDPPPLHFFPIPMRLFTLRLLVDLMCFLRTALAAAYPIDRLSLEPGHPSRLFALIQAQSGTTTVKYLYHHCISSTKPHAFSASENSVPCPPEGVLSHQQLVPHWAISDVVQQASYVVPARCCAEMRVLSDPRSRDDSSALKGGSNDGTVLCFVLCC